MTKNKLAIIGGSGLYEIEGLESLNGNQYQLHGEIHLMKYLNFNYKGKEVCFLPRHARGHRISPSKYKL